MTPERWKKVEAIFTAALAFEAGEREDFVRRACANDEELQKQVFSMLAQETDADSLFDSGVFSLLETETESASGFDENINRQIGVYRLIKQLGTGGMGAVYLAERADQEFRQKVAVKLIKRGLDTDLVLKRFRLERQILADLNHPHIARLLDGGTTPDGLPYFVMEYIDGTSILEYCNEHKLSIKERLELFLQVCSAVQFAHQKSVIHRDIKPRNILVTSEGTARLLDFGIAKILSGENDADIQELTTPTFRILTPEYASPEHLLGLEITQVSDIYSLGVLLYELLTDRHPFRFQNPLGNETDFINSEFSAAKPSEIILKDALDLKNKSKRISPEIISERRGMSVAQLETELRGNLDSIVLKAINKNPALRQQSVYELVNDVNQYLKGKTSSNELIPLNLSKPLHSVQNTDLEKSETDFDPEKSASPRQKGIKQAAALLMSGIVGTPVIIFLSLQFGFKPTWVLIFAVITFLGGIMRLIYAFLFESSKPQNLQIKRVRGEYLNQLNNESHPLNNQPVSPGYWMDDSNDTGREKEIAKLNNNQEQK
jgi:eukaryotic-like serine/threonine-protein kinase